MKPINRRQALALLAALPAVARVGAQVRPDPKYRVVPGALHGLLLEPGGTLQGWHSNASLDGLAPNALGLGHNRPLAAYLLAAVPDVQNVVAAAAGGGCSFAVLADGRLLSWGLNAGNGMLGTTPLSQVEVSASWGPNSNVPVPVATKFEAVDVSSQDSHVLALTRDGRVYAWGKGDKGRLGIGPMPVINFRTRTPAAMSFLPFPMLVPDLNGVKAIGAGGTHSLALLADGTVRAWGENRWGSLGDGTTTNRDRPVVVQGVRNAVAIAASGSGCSVALLADGTVMTWGNSGVGALGRPPWGDNAAPSVTPALVPGVKGIRAIATGHAHVLALTGAGTVISWGNDTFGSLGRGNNQTNEPAPIPSLAGVQSVAAFDATSFAVLASGRIMTWGTVRPWTRPPDEGARANASRKPILLWLDGLDQP